MIKSFEPTKSKRKNTNENPYHTNLKQKNDEKKIGKNVSQKFINFIPSSFYFQQTNIRIKTEKSLSE